MSRRFVLILVVVLVAGSFFAGYRLHRASDPPGDAGGRTVLYWADPMNPALHSSKPGIAPCGMPYEPVYANVAAMPPGSVQVSPNVEQLAGVVVEAATTRSIAYPLRLLGRVAADETRIYRLYSVTEGWMRTLSSAANGSLVKKDELLGTYSSQEILGPQQAYLSALDTVDRISASPNANAEQIELNRKNLNLTKQQLLNLGMSETQVQRVGSTHKPSPTVELRAPASGFVLARNVSPGQRFDRTTELYVIADLERVWILADAFGDDASHLTQGMTVKVRVAGQREESTAVVGPALPQFDAATKVLTVRLEASNPRWALRPGMFVDVEAAVTLPPALVVPARAVLDSGLEKTVFVDRGAGSFERRSIRTGWRAAGFVEVVSGLAPGEKVAVSGNFLLDSESRMRLAEPRSP